MFRNHGVAEMRDRSFDDRFVRIGSTNISNRSTGLIEAEESFPAQGKAGPTRVRPAFVRDTAQEQ